MWTRVAAHGVARWLDGAVRLQGPQAVKVASGAHRPQASGWLAGEEGIPVRERRLHTQQGLWLNIEQQPDGPLETITEGSRARADLRREACRIEGRHSAQRAQRDDQVRQALALRPHLRMAVVASSMLSGLEHTLHEVLFSEAPGIADGLRRLALKRGDAVAECDPGDLALPVQLASQGCLVTLVHGDMLISARMWDEVEAYRRGEPRGLPRERPDGKAWLEPQQYQSRAREAGACLTVQPGVDWHQLQGRGEWRALLSRGRLAFRDPDEAHEELKAAARLLAPGGGLLFRMPHAAGEADPVNAGWTRRRLQLGALEDVARRQGLNLRCAHLTFDSPGLPSGTLLAPRVVAPECNGWVDFHNVDAAAWDGWKALSQEGWIKQHPMTVEVSGMFERQ